MILSYLFPLFLFGAAMALLASHRRAWMKVQQEWPGAEELDFRRRQYRRRMQTTGMLAVTAFAVSFGEHLPKLTDSQLAIVFYWMAVLGLVAWTILLAMVDIWATRAHYGRIARRCLDDQTVLLAKMAHKMREINKPDDDMQ